MMMNDDYHQPSGILRPNIVDCHCAQGGTSREMHSRVLSNGDKDYDDDDDDKNLENDKRWPTAPVHRGPRHPPPLFDTDMPNLPDLSVS